MLIWCGPAYASSYVPSHELHINRQLSTTEGSSKAMHSMVKLIES